MSVSNYLVTDDLTVILGLAAAGLFLLHNLYKPQSLVHPILLGRQSDVSRVRNPKESAIYRNYSTGMMGRVSSCHASMLVCFNTLVTLVHSSPSGLQRSCTF